jgi:hypothetical protein
MFLKGLNTYFGKVQAPKVAHLRVWQFFLILCAATRILKFSQMTPRQVKVKWRTEIVKML